jgi:hypothetical protein
MQVETFHYDSDSRAWSAQSFPALDSERTLVLAFGAPELRDDPAPLASLRKAYPKSLVVGCSSAGEIVGSTVRDHSLSVAVARFDRTPLLSAMVEVKSAAGSFEAGRELARKLMRPDLRGVLVLSEGLGVNGSQLVAGLNAVLPETVVVTGGLSGDGTAFKSTWVSLGEQIKSGVVVAIGFYGDHVTIGHGSKGGWDKFGPERVVTKSEGNVLHTLDGKPALALYEEYLGDKAAELPASGLLFPLAMRASAKDDKFLVRTLLAVDHEKQTMTFAGDLPKGHLVQLMKANFDRLIDGASLAAQSAKEIAPGGALAVAISCVGRRIVLGDRTEEEVEAALESLPKGAKITGFYSYGEISPYAKGHCDLHNQTMTLTVFGEGDAPAAKKPVPPTPAKKPGVPTAFGRSLGMKPPAGAAEFEDPETSERTLARPRVSAAPSAGMALETFHFDLDKKAWSVAPLPALDSERTLVLAFGAPGLIDDPAAWKALRRSYPRSIVVGCSSAGEIVGATVRDRSLSVAVARFAKTPLLSAVVDVKSAAGSFEAGRELAQKLARPDLRGVLVLSEGLGVNGSQLVAGLNAVLPESVVVTGGLSGDGTAFKRTWVAYGDQIKSGVVVAVGFYGDHIVIGHGSKGGWDKFGPERVVTKSEGNVLHTLDGKPALALYEEYLGDKAAELPASGLLFPLAMRASAKDDKFLVRTLLAVDHEKQTMTFAGDLPKGHLVQLMKANFDRLIDGASLAAQSAKELGGAPAGKALAVAISCVGRRIVLGDRTEEEVEAALDALPKGARLTGFYSYGEISPYAKGHCDLHNQTMTLTVFSESETPVVRAKPRVAEADDGADVETQAAPGPSSTAMRLETVSYDVRSKRWSAPLPAVDSERTLVLGFGAPEIMDDPAPFRELQRAYPEAQIVGCSSAGEIVGTSVRDHSLSVAVARFARTTLRRAVVEVKSAADSFNAGRELAATLDADDLRGVLVLSEGLGVNGSQLVAGLNAVLPESVVVTGGLSGDGTAFKRTWVAVGAEVKSGVVVAVGFYGDHIVIGHGSKGGWDKFGPERVVTKSEGNVLHTLDGKPALALYKEYLGDKAAELPASGLLFPLAMRASAKDDKFLVRTLLAVDHEKQTMTFAGDLPKGHLVQLMKANFDRLIDGASLAAKSAKALGAGGTSEALAVAISCVGRRIVLGDRTEEEVEAALDALPKGAKLTGFYSYGEISPYAKGHCDLHNQTMTLTVFSESETPLPKRAGQAPSMSPEPARAAAPKPPSPRVMLDSDVGETPAPPSTKRTELAPSRAQPTPPVEARWASKHAEVREAAPPGAASAGASYDVRRVGSMLGVRISGRLTEAWKGTLVAKKLEGDVVLDLGAVERITSFGVREWLQMLKEAEPRLGSLHFARCAEPVVNQVSMIRAFTGGAQIVSFWAPYRCDPCGIAFERLIDCEDDAEAISAGRAPEARCPRCGGAGSFDDDAHTYFGFAAPHAGRPVPRALREALDELAQIADPVGGEAVEKTVDGRITRVKVNVKMDAALRWNRILDGLEGQVVVDLGGAPATTPDGVAAFDAAVRRLAGDVDAIRVEGCPRPLAERYAESAPPKLAVGSLIVDGRCAPCGANRQTLVVLADQAAALREGKDPAAACKRCGAPLAFDAVRPLLAKLAGSAAPKSAPPKAAPRSLPPPQAEAVPAAQAGGGTSKASVAIIAALGAAVVILGLSALRGNGAAPAASALPAAPSAAAPPPAASGSARGSWSKGTDLPPAWVERPFAIDGDQVFIVGRGGPAASEEAAIALARSDALERLCAGMIPELSGSPVQEFVQARAVTPDRRKEVVEPAARRYLKQVGATATPERVDVVTRQRDEGVETFARYRMSKQAFTAAVESYKQTSAFQGLIVARFFPELEASIRTDGELVIVAVQKSWQTDAMGVRAGDVILDVNGHAVASVDAFARVAAEEWAKTLPGGGVTMQVESLGARRAVKVLKAATGAP